MKVLMHNKDSVSIRERALMNERGRAAKPLHEDEYPGPQVLFNAMNPGSYLPPHKHPHSEGWMPVSGLFLLATFDISGDLNQITRLAEDHSQYVVVEGNEYHTALSLRRGSIFCNINQGPYKIENKIQAPWAKGEDEDWHQYYKQMNSKIRDKARSMSLI